MRKHNIGRISILVIIINIILVLIYLADRNEITSLFNKDSGNLKMQMEVLKDENIDGEYLTMFENYLSDKKYGREELEVINNTKWYFTSDLNKTDSFDISADTVTIYCDEDFVDNLDKALNEIIDF